MEKLKVGQRIDIAANSDKLIANENIEFKRTVVGILNSLIIVYIHFENASFTCSITYV